LIHRRCLSKFAATLRTTRVPQSISGHPVTLHVTINEVPVLSIVVPAYNEEAFIGKTLQTIIDVNLEKVGFTKEIIVVNDGSKDGTEGIVRQFSQVRLVNQVPNQGRGAALKRGVREASGDYILFQDADLEYDPNDFPAMLAVLRDGPAAVYGNRLSGVIRDFGRGIFPGKHPNQDIPPWAAALVVRAWTSLLVGHWVPDMFSGIKLYPAEPLKRLKLDTSGFELDHEITVKLYRAGVRFDEAPIHYHPRSVTEGKKIRPRDGIIALWTVLLYRFKPWSECLQQAAAENKTKR
jgi:dolichol-phosphate mannosyltransferase